MSKKKLIGFGHPEPKLKIIIHSENNPTKKWVHKRGIQFLIWNLERLSLTEQEVYVDYAENYEREFPMKYVFMGQEVVKQCVSVKLNYRNNLHQYVPALSGFICSGITSAMVKASDTYRINRTLMLAAKKAGLQPEVNFSVPMFTGFSL